jgi:general secretion pathway protein L
MRFVAIWRQWIEILATVLLAWRESRRELHVLIVGFENQQVVLKETRSGGGDALLAFPTEPREADDPSQVARNSFVVLEFPAEKVVTRTITVPAQAEKFLSGVVLNQIERLSPWPAGDVLYGFDAAPSERDAAVVDVRVFMTSCMEVDAAREHMAALGLLIDRIVASAPGTEAADGAAVSVTLWSRLANASRDSLDSVSHRIGFAIGLAVAVTVVISLWASISTSLVQQESEDVTARTKAIQRLAQTGRTLSTASAPPAERAWFLKENAISSVIAMEALSRAMPDSAHLTEFRLENATLRLTGLADDAPGLLALLEHSGHMAGAHFFAPTTRGPDGKSFRFYIEAHVEPRNTVAEQ